MPSKPQTHAEKSLAEATQQGADLDCSTCADTMVRPEFLRALMLGQACGENDPSAIDPPGAVRLKGAKIAGGVRFVVSRFVRCAPPGADP